MGNDKATLRFIQCGGKIDAWTNYPEDKRRFNFVTDPNVPFQADRAPKLIPKDQEGDYSIDRQRNHSQKPNIGGNEKNDLDRIDAVLGRAGKAACKKRAERARKDLQKKLRK